MSIRLAGLAFVAGTALGFAAPSSSAQADVTWVTFTRQPDNLAVSPLAISDKDTQVLFRTADLNEDGWDDVVAVRKQQGGQLGKRAAMLLINDHGVLRDQTALYASTSDVAGDSGFLTPCNTYEAAIGDVNGDGWPDVVTCAGLSDGAPKSISHPRVYMNLGDDAGGNWLGLQFQNARMPQLVTVGGLPVAPRFSGLALADVNGDGFPDLYFVDFDGTETGVLEPANWDLNDRLLVNDGNGFFTDQSLNAFTPTQLQSGFGTDVEAVDLNNDGANDIVKVSTLEPPVAVRALYNNPADVGNFSTTGVSDFGSNSPLGVDVGDLNHDALKDVVILDANADRFRFGTGFNGVNKMVWGPLKTFSFVSTSGDDGFGRSVYLRDLDGDGWNDVLITCVDVDLLGCARRLHIYHNTGSVPGDMNLVLKEEAEFANSGTGPGWKGVVGLTAADEKGTYDVGFGDFDNDGDLDLLVATCTGTQFYRNETKPWTNLGFALPGTTGAPLLIGLGPLSTGSSGTLTLSNAAPSAPSLLFIATSSAPVAFKCGTLVPFPWAAALPLTTDATGKLPLAWAAWPAGLSGVSLYWQCAVQDAGASCGVSLSNALRADVP